jgi:hypothetical protein
MNFVMIVLLASLSGMAQSEPPRIGDLEIETRDANGQRESAEKIQLIGARSIDYSASVRRQFAHGLPYGPYFLSVWSRRSRVPAYRELYLNRPLMKIAIGFPKLFDDDVIVTYHLAGRVTSASGEVKNCLVSVMGVYFDFASWKTVDEQGHFEIAGVPLGEFVIAVSRDEKLVFAERFNSDARSKKGNIEMEIKIDDSSVPRRSP